MLTEWDEYMIHQTGDPITVAERGDPNFFERLYLGCHNREGTLHLAVGLVAYPNKSILGGYVILREQHVQYNLRLSRHVKGRHADTEIGPLSIQVLEPHKRWAVRLGDNPQGLRCDVEFEGQVPPYLCDTTTRVRAEGGVVTGHGHYFQPGRFSGAVILHGRRLDLDGFVGVRDRSWGMPGWPSGYKGLHFWFHVHFPRCTASLIHVEMKDGTVVWSEGAIWDEHGRMNRITRIRHRAEFLPRVRAISAVEILMNSSDGQQRRLRAKPISPAVYLNGGGYNRMGEDRGPLSVESDQWDVSEPPDVDSPRFGITEPIGEFYLEGERGVGILEYSFSAMREYQYRPTL